MKAWTERRIVCGQDHRDPVREVKLWNTTSGFCYVTFSEHTATVTGIVFTPQANAIVRAGG